MSFGIIKIENASIVSVEKGNVDKDNVTGQRVTAFTVESNGVKVKLLLKDNKAKVVWDLFVKDGKSRDSINDIGGTIVYKGVKVSFVSEIREVRDKEIITHNAKDLVFTFDYLVD